jgi:hypothetical protein
MASNGSLYLVTGVDKASCWGVASFSNSSGETGISLKFTAAHNAGVPATRHYAWERSGRVAARSGPRRQVGPENQCVFIRGYKLALRGGLLSAALKGPVKVSHIVDTSPSDVLAKGDSIPGAPKSSFFGSRFGGDSKGSCSEGPKDSVDAESINVGVVAELFPGMSEVMFLMHVFTFD